MINSVADPSLIGELAERYWRYVFHHQSVGPTVGYHDTQSVNRLLDFGLSSLVWLGAETPAKKLGHAAPLCFSRENPAILEWLAPIAKLRPGGSLSRFLQYLTADSLTPEKVHSVSARFLEEHEDLVADRLLSMVESLPGAGLTLTDLYAFFRLLAVEMLNSTSGSWEARIGYVRVRERLGLQASKSAEQTTRTVEINLSGLAADREVRVAADVMLLPGWRIRLPFKAEGEHEPEIDPRGARIAVEVFGRGRRFRSRQFAGHGRYFPSL